jgi:hypothetical protein
LRALLGLVAFVAVAFAAIANADNLIIRSTVQTVTFLLLFCATTLAITTNGIRRAACIGFALFGWGYFLVSEWTSQGLVTTQLLIWLWEITNDEVVPVRQGYVAMSLAMLQMITVGNCFWCILLALSGGWLGRVGYLSRKTERDR